MYIYEELKNIELPNRYFRNKTECFLDPIRQKLIKITPEEIVRHKIIKYLTIKMIIPVGKLIVEVPIKGYGISSTKRADIIIEYYEQGVLKPLFVVECKAQQIELTNSTAQQVMHYSHVIGAQYMAITNGEDFYMVSYEPETDSYIAIEEIPLYEELINQNVKKKNFSQIEFIRTRLEDLKNIEYIEDKQYDYDEMLGYSTKDEIKPIIFNLGECFLDTSRFFPTGIYNKIKIVKDVGLRRMSYGNASGGSYPGNYRTIMIEDKNQNNQMISFAVLSGGRNNKEGEVITDSSYLIVAIDDFEKSHNSLQLKLDKFLEINSQKYNLWHDGRISIGDRGCGKTDELKKIIKKEYPELLSGNIITLGNFDKNKLLYLDDPQIVKLVVNIIEYALVRDVYREIVKKELKH